MDSFSVLVGREPAHQRILPYHFSYFPLPFCVKVRRQSNGIGSELVLCIITERSLFGFLDNIIPSLDNCLSSLVYCVGAYRTCSHFFHFIFRPSGLLLYPLSPLYYVVSPVNSPAQFIPDYTNQGFFLLPLKQKKKGGSVGGYLSVFVFASWPFLWWVGWIFCR